MIKFLFIVNFLVIFSSTGFAKEGILSKVKTELWHSNIYAPMPLGEEAIFQKIPTAEVEKEADFEYSEELHFALQTSTVF